MIYVNSIIVSNPKYIYLHTVINIEPLATAAQNTTYQKCFNNFYCPAKSG